MLLSFIRSIILFTVIITALRIMGKRQIGEMEPAELVVAVLISGLASVPMQDIRIPLISGIIPIITVLALEMLLSAISMKSIAFRSLLSGKPAIIIKNGRPLEKEMEKNRFTLDELEECLRRQGITDICTVKYGILETNGQLSAIQYAHATPPSAMELGIVCQEQTLPVIIINNGRILENNLKYLGLNNEWLNTQLTNLRKSAKDIFLFTVDETGKTFFIPKED